MTNGRKLSTFVRHSNLDEMASAQLDLLVIGGGITGAGIALDAASRGMRIGLVEKQDFSAGTSSRSTKLIHGGLRYLKQGEIKLVQEVGRERAIVYHNAPHLVIPEKMLLPLVKKGTYGKWATSVGLWMYDRLAGVKHEERRKMLSKQEVEQLEPLLRKDILIGGSRYIEYRTDDARLTVEVLKTAVSYDAICANYAEVTEFLYEGGKVDGVRVSDRLSGESYEIYAKHIVNASGPWVDQLRKMDHSLTGKRLRLTKGVHLVVKRSRFPLRQAVYFDVPDGRMIFAIPRDETTYIGTTDTDYAGILERPTVTKDDANYLLDAVNTMFPDVKLTRQDLVSSWAGLRPLWHEEGKAPSELSRKDEVVISSSGLITIAGGKLTGYRKMAERVVDIVLQRLGQEDGRRFAPCRTNQITLSGGDFASPEKIPEFVKQNADPAKRIGATEQQVWSLVRKYGTNSRKILQRAAECHAWAEATELTEAARCLLRAEVQYAIEEEMATNLNDFLIRRTGSLLFERDTVETWYEMVLEDMTRCLHWSESDRTTHLLEFKAECQTATRFE